MVWKRMRGGDQIGRWFRQKTALGSQQAFLKLKQVRSHGRCGRFSHGGAGEHGPTWGAKKRVKEGNRLVGRYRGGGADPAQQKRDGLGKHGDSPQKGIGKRDKRLTTKA